MHMTSSDSRRTRRIAFAMFVGTALETYDFMLYGLAAPLVFTRLFFVSNEPFVATLGALGTFAVGFAMRPLGAMLFGHLGDRFGRRKCLIATIAIIGITTCLIGMLPTYAVAGIMAPLVLTMLRAIQGIAIGGEWGGAIALAVEHAPPDARARSAAMTQLGAPIGILTATAAFFLVSLLPPAMFDLWGWRLPFLAAFPMLLGTLWLRRQVDESPMFEQVKKAHHLSHFPAREVIFDNVPRFLVGTIGCMLGIGGFYLMSSYVISYGTSTLHLPRPLLLAASAVASVVQIFVVLVGSRLGERFSNAGVVAAGGVLTLLLAFPVFALIDTGQPWAVILGITLGTASVYIPVSVIGQYLAELFPVERRYSGLGICSNIAGVFCGFVPMLAATMQHAAGGSWAVSMVLAALALMTMVAALAAPRFAVRGELFVGRIS
ncbi:MFS transporter [Flavisphingomonas formosensis]|uniref:MFS transporter n=1 Tax=Flavisphingomonas formosensis TaxID=861534 RepID=UPI0012F75778|nr:MFS transporter [Sphingomonas formosensis]